LSTKKNTVSIHQPGYIPWMGFFKKIQSSDIFIFLDDVQFEKNGWHNRNKIKTSENWMWLTIPVKAKLGMNLNEIKIDYSSKWINKHKKSIELNYSKTKFFKEYWRNFEEIFEKKYEFLIDINVEFINKILEMLNVKTKIILSSSLGITKKKSARILEICKSVNTSNYLSGIMGEEYLNLEEFKKNGIMVNFQDYQHPIYKQNYESFLPNMSIIDLLFNEGSNSEKILRESKNKKYEIRVK
jgi:hypothetical protein